MTPFIVPAQPTLRDRPPKGESWVHEVKFDGYRVQLHKDGKDIAIYSRNGLDFTSRFPAIAYVLAHLPTRSVIIDAEAVAVTAQGLPNFSALHRRRAKPEEVCCYAFDLLRHNSLDARPLPLVARRARLEKILGRFGNGCLMLTETFADGEKLLAECEQLGIEGIVSKRKDAPYRSGNVRLDQGEDQGLARVQQASRRAVQPALSAFTSPRAGATLRLALQKRAHPGCAAG
jgi:bifunctional non-homologous end joining protein LigD